MRAPAYDKARPKSFDLPGRNRSIYLVEPSGESLSKKHFGVKRTISARAYKNEIRHHPREIGGNGVILISPRVGIRITSKADCNRYGDCEAWGTGEVTGHRGS